MKEKIFSVSLVLSIKAKNKEEAISKFYLIANECAFDRDSIEVEIEK